MKFKSMIVQFRDYIFNIIGYISLVLTILSTVLTIILTGILLSKLIDDDSVRKTLIEIGISLSVGGISCGLFCFCRENY
jgi:hypothetical protein